MLFNYHKARLMNPISDKWLPETSCHCCGVIFVKGIEVFFQRLYLKYFCYSSEISEKGEFYFQMCFMGNKPK